LFLIDFIDSKPLKISFEIRKFKINELVIGKILEWDSTAKILITKGRDYAADFAWDLKKLNSFHEKNIKRHLETLLKNGFKI